MKYHKIVSILGAMVFHCRLEVALPVGPEWRDAIRPVRLDNPYRSFGTADKYPNLIPVNLQPKSPGHNVGQLGHSRVNPILMDALLISPLSLLFIAIGQCPGAKISGNVEMVDSLGRLWGTPCGDIGCTSSQTRPSSANCAK